MSNLTPKRMSLHDQIANTIRGLTMDAVQKANSGHPGAPMGLAPAAYVLFKRFLKHNPKNPAWKPFQYLEQCCRKCGYDDMEARDIIEEQIGRRLECECQLLGG